MEILNEIVLKNDVFSLKKGEAAFIFAQQPQKGVDRASRFKERSPGVCP